MTVQHRRLREDPAPLSIVNPVYDDNVGDIELHDKTEGANGSKNSKSSANNNNGGDGDIAVNIDPETPVEHEPTSETSPSNGEVSKETVNASNENGAHHSAWHNGTEPDAPKLITPNALTLGQYCTKRVLVVIAILLVLLLIITLTTYFLVPNSQSSSSSKSSGAVLGRWRSSDEEKSLVVRLTNFEPNRGVLQLKSNDNWLSVCAQDWNTSKEATVVCRQLEQRYEVTATLQYVDLRSVNSNGTVSLNYIKCAGDENNLTECDGAHKKSDYVSCVRGVGISVKCERVTVTTYSINVNGSSATAKVTQPIVSNSITTTPTATTSTATTATATTATAMTPTAKIPTAMTIGYEALEIRLNGLSGPHEGRLEVLRNGVWGTVCGNNWGPQDALVVCSQLGYRNYSQIRIRTDTGLAGDDLAIWLKDMSCAGTEVNIGACQFSENTTMCTHVEDVVLSCLTDESSTSSTTMATTTTAQPITTPLTTTPLTTTATTTPLTTTAATTPAVPTTTARPITDDSTLRILHGNSPNEGLIVITSQGVDYTLCDTYWTPNDAAVACRMSNYTEVIRYHTHRLLLDPDDHYNASLYSRFPSKVICLGNETQLSHCRFEVIDQPCSSYEDVKIICGPIPATTTTTVVTSPATTLALTNATSAITTTIMTTLPTTTTTSTPLPTTTTDSRPVKEKALVRLNGGPGDYVGRLEILINNTWGTVCDDGWTTQNAQVVCTQLHYSAVDVYQRFTQRDGVEIGKDSQKIWLKNIDCDGSEEYLTACVHELADSGTLCEHREDIMMSCESNETSTTPPDVHINGDLRLNPGPHIGRLEFYWQGEWGAVCDEGWDMSDAVVACQQLGYTNVSAHTVGGEDDVIGEQYIDYFVSEIHCLGTEQHLKDCRQLPIKENECYDYSWFWGGNSRIFIACDAQSKVNSTDVASAASSEVFQPITQLNDSAQVSNASGYDPRDRIRLVNGLEDINVGMLQYKLDGQWGRVCADGWTNKSADVACKQLGFPGGVQSYNLSIADVSNISAAAFAVPFHGKNYQCNNIDTELANCSHFQIATNCRDNEDEVAISCQPRPEQILTPDPTVRLVGGSSKFEGRVEVLLNGTWGRVCKKHWTNDNMEFVCVNLFGIIHFTHELTANLTSLPNGPFVAGNFSCIDADGSSGRQVETPHFSECSHRSDSEFLDLCSVDAQVRCLS